ncbi:cobalt-precorrin-7 (C(5))-methyltransferase [Halorubellus sp. PRR65]|uniref:cobalt-precorrin-7 (C(5))-methyltransferase n=1 Tax=Halorubellus sp. PRR65 TaxID=3098148 RepID=UPI002B26057A|nr:cobalt-precorrin-7 (C(5))-methyltransferase [Halorubellus sp. PRR65]
MTDEYDLDAGPDPAAFAASAPEAPATGSRSAAVDAAADETPPVHAVGVGPGNPEFLTPRGERAIREADVVVGFETVVEFVAEHATGEVLACGYRDEGETLAAFADRVADGARGTAVLMGDPNHSGYQFVGKVERAVDAPVRVVPGISSLQVAASRARAPMEASTFVTLHKSGDVEPDLERLRADVGDRHLLVLPRPFDLMPEAVAADLVDAGADPALSALVLERLTHAEETVTRSTLGELAADSTGPGDDAAPAADAGSDSSFSDLSVLVVRADAG